MGIGTNKSYARLQVRVAVKKGILKKLPCKVCGIKARLQAHHEDYSKPLEVVWLCATHHYDLHQKENPPHKLYNHMALERHILKRFKELKPDNKTNSEFLEILLDSRI